MSERSTRNCIACAKRGEQPPVPYLILLRMGFALPPRSLSGRWSLTPPFHPCPGLLRGGLFSVALSILFDMAKSFPVFTGSSCSVESGLSSRSCERATNRLRVKLSKNAGIYAVRAPSTRCGRRNCRTGHPCPSACRGSPAAEGSCDIRRKPPSR